MTLRSNDQFNTTIYGYSDRLRGIEGTRDVLLMNPEDIAAAGLDDGPGRRRSRAMPTTASIGRSAG